MDFLQRNQLWALPPDQETEDRRLKPRWGRWSYASLTTLTGLSSVLVFNSLCLRPLMWRPWNHFIAMTVYGILGYRVGRVCEDAHGWMRREREAYSRLPAWVRVRRAEENGGYPEDGIEQVKTTQQLRRSIVVDDVKNFQVQKAAHERAVAAGEAEPGSFKSPLMPFSLPQISSSEFAEFLASLVENEGGKEYARKTAPKEPEKVIYDLAEYGDQAADFQQRLYEVALPVYSDDLQSWEFSDRLASDPLAAHAMLTSILSLVKVEESRASADQPNSQVFALMDAVTVCIGDFVSESTREHGKPNLTLKHVFSDTDNNPVWSYGYESNKQKWDSLISKSQEYLEYAHKRLQAVAKGKTEQSIDDEAGDEQLAIASVDPSTARKLMLCIEFIIEAMHAGRHGRSFDETNFLRKRLAQEPLSVEEQNQLIKVIEMRKQAARQIYLDNIHATAPRTLDNRTLVSIMAEYGYTVKD